MLDYTFEDAYHTEGHTQICGVDEAGRGPLAGPVVAGACILPTGLIIPGLDDSKKLSEKKRELLYDTICQSALSWSIGIASVEEIDTLNILEASLLAMRRAVASLSLQPDLLLIDGNISRGFSQRAHSVIGGDGICQSIAAASILAKVTRDRLCTELDHTYPLYGFAKHKGYPTKAHKLAVYQHGPCPAHRKTFLSFLERDRNKLEMWLSQQKAAQ